MTKGFAKTGNVLMQNNWEKHGYLQSSEVQIILFWNGLELYIIETDLIFLKIFSQSEWETKTHCIELGWFTLHLDEKREKCYLS